MEEQIKRSTEMFRRRLKQLEEIHEKYITDLHHKLTRTDEAFVIK
jgi:hypothetical protein